MMDNLITSALLFLICMLIVLAVGIFWLAEQEITALEEQVETAESCIQKEQHFDGNTWINVWLIEGEWYLVRGNEIVGRYDRFYTENGRRR
jgi:hypothetical protein